MINLFNIPTHVIDTSSYNNQVQGKIVQQFEESFAEYVGAKYAVSFNSATSAIFLMFLYDRAPISIPSIMTPVVANALINGENFVHFKDEADWVGWSYLLHEWPECKIIDSAHRVDINQFANECGDNDFMIFSFYPTKPVSGCDGGIIVSNNKDAIEKLRILANNGMSGGGNNWERTVEITGYKMYMNSIQADIALRNLKNLPVKKSRLDEIRNSYNKAFALTNKSDHLYRITVKDNADFLQKAKEKGIICGIHYHSLHKMDAYKNCYYPGQLFPNAEKACISMVSIPFHENLQPDEVQKVINFSLKYVNDM